MVLWPALSMLPDADVIGFSFGVRYGDPWGHRGATHSLLFAAGVAAVVAAGGWKRGLPLVRTAILATLVLASHGLLDTLTDGGLGCALFWPFDLTRYFAPWQPIPVAPIGLRMLSPFGAVVVATELVLFAPLLAYGLGGGWIRWWLPLWAAALWLLASSDPAREALVGRVVREQTEFARGYSEPAFRAIAAGQSEADVRRQLGTPLGEYWDYFSADEAAAAGDGCPFVYLESDAVTVLARDRGPATQLCEAHGIAAGMPGGEVRRLLGPPRDICLLYSRGPEGRYYRARAICLSRGKVVASIRRWERG